MAARVRVLTSFVGDEIRLAGGSIGPTYKAGTEHTLDDFLARKYQEAGLVKVLGLVEEPATPREPWPYNPDGTRRSGA